MTNKLNYDNAAALINAFKQGAKFKIQRSDGTTEPVTRIEGTPYGFSHGMRVYTASTVAGWGCFRPDGTNSASSARLIRDESLGHIERTSVTVGESIFGWVPPGKAAPVAEKPLLQRLLSGETFHNPKTRETLDSFQFSKGTLIVTLKGEDGALRTSERYDHNGKHKWRPERSLVAGPVPPKPVVKTFSSEDLWTTAPDGYYHSASRGLEVKVISNGTARAVLFHPDGIKSVDHVDLLSRTVWTSERFVAGK